MSKFRDSLFQRLFSIIALIALFSIFLEIKGTFLKNGITPFASIHSNFNGLEAFFKSASIFCFCSEDWFIYLVLFTASLSLVFLASHFFRNRFLRASLFLAFYFLYISFVNFGSPFMNFQWDALLLESAFLFFLYFFLNQDTKLAKINIWLFRILIFKLMLMSGLAKVFSGDNSWLDFSALQYHYFTQPLPNFLSFFFHQLPTGFHEFSTVVMFLIELLLPFFIFFGKRFREFAAWAFITLQVLIFITGNYGFFNLLTIVLCFSLFDFKSSSFALDKFKFHKTFKLISVILVIVYSIISLSLVCSRIKAFNILTKPAELYNRNLGILHLCNPYGLFATMTKIRGEIIIQGGKRIPGQFGIEWKDYKFKFKPQDTKLLPMQVAPLQARLDWQMWFAALSDYQKNPWFVKLVEKLLVNDEDVLGLFANNPFPDSAPDVIRALYFDYKFNKLEDYFQTKEVWLRKYSKVYLPEVSLKR